MNYTVVWKPAAEEELTMFVHPLGVFFHVQEQDRIVSVVGVWRVV